MASHKKKIKLKVRVNKDKREKKSFEERVIKEEGFIDHFDEKVDYYVDEYVEKVERTKQLTLISGVTFFMLLIVFFYAFSFKTQITSIADDNNNNNNIDHLGDLKNNIDRMVDDFKEIKESLNTGIEDIKTTETMEKNSSVLPESENSDIVSIEELKNKLLEENK